MSPFVGAKAYPDTKEGNALAQADSEQSGVPITEQSNPNLFGRKGGAMLPETSVMGHVPPAFSVPPEPVTQGDVNLSARVHSLEGQVRSLASTVRSLQGAVDELLTVDPRPDQGPDEEVGQALTAAVDDAVGVQDDMDGHDGGQARSRGEVPAPHNDHP